MPTEHDIETAAAAVPAMRTANRSDLSGMARHRQPVMDGGSDPAALDWRLTLPFMARDQQHDAVAAPDRLVKALVNRGPRLVEIVAVKIDGPVRLDRPAFQPPIPAAVQRRAGARPNQLSRPALGRWRSAS